MAQVLSFFITYEAVLYFVLGLAAIFYIYRFWTAWQESQLAVYGLEQQAAQGRLNQSAVVLFLLLLTGVLVFSMVTFVAPTLPAQALLATPTLNLAVEPLFKDTTLTPASGEGLEFATATPLPTVRIDPEGCVVDQAFISSPKAGDTLQGSVEVTGTADAPNFGFYKFEVARAQEELWLTIQAGRNVVRDGVLVENWDTSRLPVGDYVLQLIVTNSAGDEMLPCRIPVRIAMPEASS
ncbi:MAG: hypothetical protein DWG76_02650 [Chloroflexi bacterium]|nr:hypothetical protein [Chloroflexota bacterium]